MTVSEIIKELWLIEPAGRAEFLPEMLKVTLAHQVYEEKVKETALDCYMEDMYMGLLMQECNKTLDEFFETWGFNELVRVLTEREAKINID